jgi:hypothetical protein
MYVQGCNRLGLWTYNSEYNWVKDLKDGGHFAYGPKRLIVWFMDL